MTKARASTSFSEAEVVCLGRLVETALRIAADRDAEILGKLADKMDGLRRTLARKADCVQKGLKP